MSENWTNMRYRLPPNGEVVETKIDDSRGVRNLQDLKRRDRLWFYADGSGYVYYEPTHWRRKGGDA